MHGGGYAGALLVMIWPLLPTIEPGGTTEPGGNTVPPVTGMGILANMPCAAGRSSRIMDILFIFCARTVYILRITAL